MKNRFWLPLLAMLAGVNSALAVGIGWSSSPGSAVSGQGYYVEAYAHGTHNGYSELWLYKNGAYVAYNSGSGTVYAGTGQTDNGVQTITYYAEAFDDYDTSGNTTTYVSITQPNTAPGISWSQNPGSVPVNQWFTVEAHGRDPDGNLTNVYVWREWSPFAFGDGGNGYDKYCGNNTVDGSAGTVTFMARAVDSNGAESPVIYHSINIYVPNVAPTVTWVNNPPASVYVNQSFNMQARANDGNGNLAWVYVWRDEQPFAFNAASGGESYSDNNAAVGTAPGTTAFKAKSGDTGGLESGFIYHNVTIVNRTPTVSASAAGAVAGRPITVNWSAGDPDGNFSNVQVWVTQWGSPYWDYLGSFGASGSTQWSSSTHFNSNNPAAGAYLFVVRANDAAGAYTDAHATFDITNQPPDSPAITGSGAGVTYNSAGQHYEMWVDNPITLNATIHDADGNLALHAIWHNNGTGITDGSAWQQLTDGTPSHGTNSTLNPVYTPLVPGRWDFHANGKDAAGVWAGGASITAYVYGPTNSARFVSQTVNNLDNPSAITVNPGQTFPVSITMRNNGSKPWNSDGTPHRLGSVNDAPTWGLTRVALPAPVINPLPQAGSDATFNFTATAPTAPGTYTFLWGMVEEGVQWFGANAPAVTVTVANVAPTVVSATGGTIAYGQSFSTTLHATDANADLTQLHLVVASAAFNAAANNWEGTSPDGWKWRHFRSDAVSGGDATITVPVQDNNYGTPHPLPVGTYRLTLNAQDSLPNYTYSASNVLATLMVAKSTPVGTFASRSVAASGPGYTIQAGDLNATFANAYSGAAVAPAGAITYSMVGSGAAVNPGTVLPSGQSHAIRASYPGDANYDTVTSDATFTVSLDPAADNDGDGMPNDWETQHGLNPQSGADGPLDPDNDGLSNSAEYNLDRNPRVYDAGTGDAGNSIVGGWPNGGSDQTYAVGATTGTLHVDKSGAAGYSVPLWVTPGTAGMQPQLALSYSSQAGAGLAGFGWSLSGASVITRGPQTRALDGQNRGVTLTASDRFYLDGQRLVYLGGGTGYGTDGSEYRTELESITKVVATGPAGSGPASFTAWTKAGLIIQFGQTADSTFDAWGRSEKLSWHVNRISDTKGNYMDFVYYEDAANGVHRLERINYTGNGGVAPYASVRLGYEPRADAFHGYQAGSKISSTQRLKTIGSYHGETKAREYTLDYIERANTGRSILTALHEKGSDNKEYPPLTFSYEAPTTGWDENATTDANWGAPAAITKYNDQPRGTGFVDLNGDGRPDFVQFHRAGSADERAAWINTVNGWVVADGSVSGVPDFRLPAPLATDGYLNNDNGNRFADVNSDGRPDFFVNSGGTGGSGVFCLNTGAGFQQDNAWDLPLPPPPINYDFAIISSCSKAMFVDLNGDGRPDLVARVTYRYHPFDEINPVINRNERLAWLNTGSGWQMAAGYYPPFDMEKGSRFVDVNGDGLPDQVQHWRDQGTILKGVALNTGTGWNTLAAGSADETRYLPPVLLNQNDGGTDSGVVGTELVDLNGDGLVDLIHRYDSGVPGYPNTAAYLNTGYGWVSAPAFLSPYNLANNNSPQGVAFLDVNTDGLPDLVYSWDAGGRDVRLNTGQGWSGSVSNYNLVRQMSQPGRPSTGTDLVDLDGDGVIDQSWNYLENSLTTRGAALNRNIAFDRLQAVTNGFGVAATVAYAPLTAREADGSFTIYDKGTGGPAGSANVIGPMWVVKSVTHDDGVGGQYAVNYRYGGLRSDLLRGALGFEWMRVTDGRTGIVSTSTSSQVYPFIGLPVAAETKTAGGTTLSTSAITYAEVPGLAAGTHLPYAAQSVESSYELNGALIATITTAITDIDLYGNVKAMTVSTNDGFAKATTNQYNEDNHAAWRLGRLTNATVVSSAPGVSSLTRNSSFHYDPATGLLLTETVEAGDATLALTTTYGYDLFGNKTSVAVSGATITVTDANGTLSAGAATSRATTTQYDSNGRFPLWTENALGHRENYTAYDQALGVLTAMTGANGLPTSWGYDGFGRKTSETRADNTHSATAYRWVSSLPAGAATYPGGTAPTVKYSVETTTDGAPPSLAFYDSFGRAFLGLGVTGDGAITYQATTFDAMGRAYAKSNPYLNNGSPVYWSVTTQYDLLNRPLTVQTPDDQNGPQTTSMAYAGLTTTVTDAKGRVSKTVKNTQGWAVENIRNDGNPSAADYSRVAYAYDALGNLTSTDAAGVVTALAYDLRGRKTSMTDADMGAWLYRYNIFGELIWQTDAKGQVTTLAYDNLGRLTSRVEPEGATTWTYDTASRSGGTWLGKLASVASPGGYAETYAYDALGRPATLARTIDGGTYQFDTAYDSLGRQLKTTYPTVNGGRFATRQVYNALGYLKEIRSYLATDDGKPNSQLAGRIYWQADHYDQSGRIDGEIYGNGLANDRVYSAATGRLLVASVDKGRVTAAPYAIQQMAYTYDQVGNVLTRADQAVGRGESFAYDGLDRLLTHNVVTGAGGTVNVTYDQKGNITSKSDVGTYTYDATKKHAMVSILAPGSSTPVSYSYDANGNMTSGGGRGITWTSFNQAASITKGAYSSTFSFGASHERVKQVSHLETTVYVGVLFEKVTPVGGGAVTEFKHYIVGPTGRIAVYTDRSNLTRDTRYFHTDGLGSITAVSDEKGAIVKRFAFDAWGKRIDPASGATITGNTAAGLRRGYTDHEQLDDLGLVHMNGRVYDSVLGRFLSADPNVDGVGDAQGYNRYSYLGNNPLGGTDPSGYFSLKDAVKIVAVVVAAYFTAGLAVYAFGGVTGLAAGATATFGQSLAALAGSGGLGLSLGGAIAAGAGAGFASGFAGSLLNGGSIGDAFKAGVIGGVIGGITGGLTYGIGGSNLNYFERAGAHGLVSGAAETAQGGQFRHGFYAGFATGAASGEIGWVPKQLRFVAAAIVGGTASAVGGGKFANGAVSGAFQYLLNDSQPDHRQNAKDLTISDAGVNLVGELEGFRREIYKDQAGNDTIGFGHKLLAGESDTYSKGITRDDATKLLRSDLANAEAAVQRYVKVPLYQSEYDALVSFTYNAGGGALKGSTLLKGLNGSDYLAVPGQMARWNKVTIGGKLVESAGLTERRWREGWAWHGWYDPKH